MVKKIVKGQAENFIKFLGTSGARFVMIRQLRHSAGVWVKSGSTNVLIDPGPGSLVYCARSRPRLDPSQLDAIILTHRHLDHSGDINVMIEAMTEGGFKKRGVVFCPRDALDGDPVILKYIRNFPEKIEILSAHQKYRVGDFNFDTSGRHIHPVETYGLKLYLNGKSVGLLTDTGYFPELTDFYNADILIVGVVFPEPRPGIDHLSLRDLKALLTVLKPAKTILTHFGMGMLKAKPHLCAEELSREFKLDVVAATDGMSLPF
jgi:phosphoribosyl 1,2-cyclic phosphodiesterase